MAQSVCFVSTYPPRQCGIASFTRDLIQGLEQAAGKALAIRVLAMGDGHAYTYPDEVLREIPEDEPQAYVEAAQLANETSDVVCIQHEYGIFGGEAGEHILGLARALERPLITTLHTVLPDPSRQELRVLQELAHRSERVVVMSRAAIPILSQRYGIPVSKIRLIRHGAPHLPVDPQAKTKLGLEDRVVMSTFGFIGPGKGLEYAIDTVARLAEDHPKLLYLILGRVHPRLEQGQGPAYRRGLEERVQALDLGDHVRFVDRYLSLEELSLYLSATDIYFTPYPGRNQISSGTLTFALATGRAIVSTPYLYAQDVLGGGRGLLVPFSDPDAMAAGIRRLLEEPGLLTTLQRRAQAFARQLPWATVARQYVELFREMTEPARARARRRLGHGPKVVTPWGTKPARVAMAEEGKVHGGRAGRSHGLAAR
ncbi:MAG: glycosyl transferase family 1 [Firmicutes bacterium]|nr:glycosyl transferase family 1 [Bacillota bacterium]